MCPLLADLELQLEMHMIYQLILIVSTDSTSRLFLFSLSAGTVTLGAGSARQRSTNTFLNCTEKMIDCVELSGKRLWILTCNMLEYVTKAIKLLHLKCYYRMGASASNDAILT